MAETYGEINLDYHGTFTWWVESQDTEANTSTIGWELYGEAAYIPPSSTNINFYSYSITNERSVIASETFSSPIEINLYDSVSLASGSFIVQHNHAGEGTVRFTVELLGAYTWNMGGQLTRTSFNPSGSTGLVYLPSIPVASQISCAGGSVGSTVSIIINKRYSDLTHTLGYSFGSLSGTIVEKYDGSRYDWTIPAEFSSQFTDDVVKTCLISCSAYLGNKSTGLSSTEIKVKINEEDGAPTLAPVVIDIKPETLALTGDENTLVKHESMVEYAFNVSTWNNVPVNTYTITNGSKVIDSSGQGVIDDIESETFVFKVEDSLGFTKEVALTKNAINYVKPTCHLEFITELEDITKARITTVISGNYYSGSFGLVNNTLKLEVRHTDAAGVMGEWEEIEYTVQSLNDSKNTYNINAVFSGFDYTKQYTFQARLTDKLNVVQSAQEAVQLLPVFDWSNEDFNFNVPVNMNGETVLRHNKEANNTVLSASGGHIYLRPAGTNETENEAILYPDGSVEFSGDINVKNQNIDYVIETGSEPMGTNGTWYWEKWKSGKAMCYGCRNFGRMSMSTEWRNLYIYKEPFTQDFPSGLFNATPDIIDIDIRDADVSCWVVKYDEGAPSASNSGKFVVARHNTGLTNLYTNISFHAIGRWKE